MGFFPPFHENAGDRRNMDYQSQNALHGTRSPRRCPCRSYVEQVAGLGWAELGPRRKESQGHQRRESGRKRLEERRLSLKLGDAGNPRGLAIRFILTNYNKLSIQSWFTLRRVEIVSNNSIQAVFNPTGIHAPSGYSYRCQCVGNLPRDQALLLPSDTDDGSSLWEVTLIDFQIQGFAIKGARFTKAQDCASSFSPAILIGLATSLILLLVLAYALHMLIYLRYLAQHYDLITSPAHFPQLKARDTADEKELLRSQGAACYELRSQQISKIYV
ncbi:V-type proton ATPase subunit S1-like protein isoform X17 [Macaca fascicularis]|uniref:V-type proton ATPase subunit S1-like protein isoform X17 n=1 Tax=Macaca fascicularis TaxID=9541 RepID=UPI003D1588E8